MTSNNGTIIELTTCYSIISAQSLITEKPVFIDLFSTQSLWLLCLNKSSLGLIKKFHSLNKNFHHLYKCLVFGNPEGIRKKLGLNCDKGEIYWIDKRFRESLYESLQIIQLPWIISFEHGVQVYSAHDFPPDFSNLSSYKDQSEINESPTNSEMKKFTILKEQLQNLKKKVKKFERKEAEYKAEISELKGNLKNSNNEVQDLKRKVKEYEFKLTMTPDNEYKKYLPGLKEMPQKNIFSQARPVGNDDIWKINDEMQDNLKDLDDITGSRELWINNLENKIKANSFKSPTKLFPIEKAHKFNSAREFGNKRKTPEPPKMANRKYVY